MTKLNGLSNSELKELQSASERLHTSISKVRIARLELRSIERIADLQDTGFGRRTTVAVNALVDVVNDLDAAIVAELNDRHGGTVGFVPEPAV